MLIALGFRPLKTAVIALVANTAPVAFGALAVPITTLSLVSGVPQDTLGAIVGRQTPVLALFVPMALVFIIDKSKGVRETLPATIVCGVSFGLAQFVTSNYLSEQLSDVVASLVSAGCVVLLLRVWSPATAFVDNSEDAQDTKVPAGVGAQSQAGLAAAGGSDGHRVPESMSVDDFAARDAAANGTPADVARAYVPYLVIIAVFVITQLPGVKDLFDAPTFSFKWPGLHLQTAGGDPSSISKFKVNWLGAAGTLMVLSGLISIPILGISVKKALKAYVDTYKQLFGAIVTGDGGPRTGLRDERVRRDRDARRMGGRPGAAFAILSPILGWLGVAVTGSNTSSNSLFGALQVQAAHKTGLNPAVMAAANSSGGVLGKMISPQNLAIAAAVGMSGQDGEVFRQVFKWSVIFLVMCVLVFLQTTPVLSWMLAGSGA